MVGGPNLMLSISAGPTPLMAQKQSKRNNLDGLHCLYEWLELFLLSRNDSSHSPVKEVSGSDSSATTPMAVWRTFHSSAPTNCFG